MRQARDGARPIRALCATLFPEAPWGHMLREGGTLFHSALLLGGRVSEGIMAGSVGDGLWTGSQWQGGRFAPYPHSLKDLREEMVWEAQERIAELRDRMGSC